METMTAQEKTPIILADACRKTGLEPSSRTLMDLAFLLQEAYRVPTRHRFVMSSQGPWAKPAPAGIQEVREIRDAGPAQEHPFHLWERHVRRLALDFQGVDAPELSLRTNIVAAPRLARAHTQQQIVQCLGSMTPPIPPEKALESLIALAELGLAPGDEAQETLRMNLRRCLEQTPFEHGSIHPAEPIIQEALEQPDGPARIARICANPREPYIAAGLIGCLGQLQPPDDPRWSARMVRTALTSPDLETRDNAVCTTGNWDDPRLIPVLLEHREPVSYLRQYITVIIGNIRKGDSKSAQEAGNP